MKTLLQIVLIIGMILLVLGFIETNRTPKNVGYQVIKLSKKNAQLFRSLSLDSSATILHSQLEGDTLYLYWGRKR